MAIPTLEEYVRFFLDAGIPAISAQKYAQHFERNRIRVEMFPHLNKQLLNEMGIDILGDVFVILAHASDPDNSLLKNIKSYENPNPQHAYEESNLYKVKKTSLNKNLAITHRISKSRNNSTLARSSPDSMEDIIFPDGKRIKSRFQTHHKIDSIFILLYSDTPRMVSKAKYSEKSQMADRLSNTSSRGPSRSNVFSRLGQISDNKS
ncbi:hypothetical protein HZS_3218, partial [Henneguya salminicola]